MRTQSDRMRTAAHINRSFARSVELGSLEADDLKSVDFYQGRAAAYDEAADFLDPMFSAVFEQSGQAANVHASQSKKHPDQHFIICEIREIP